MGQPCLPLMETTGAAASTKGATLPFQDFNDSNCDPESHVFTAVDYNGPDGVDDSCSSPLLLCEMRKIELREVANNLYPLEIPSSASRKHIILAVKNTMTLRRGRGGTICVPDFLKFFTGECNRPTPESAAPRVDPAVLLRACNREVRYQDETVTIPDDSSEVSATQRESVLQANNVSTDVSDEEELNT